MKAICLLLFYSALQFSVAENLSGSTGMTPKSRSFFGRRSYCFMYANILIYDNIGAVFAKNRILHPLSCLFLQLLLHEEAIQILEMLIVSSKFLRHCRGLSRVSRDQECSAHCVFSAFASRTVCEEKKPVLD